MKRITFHPPEQFEQAHSPSRFEWLQKRLAPIFMIGVVYLSIGCTRSQYRAAADCESNHLIASRMKDLRWQSPFRSVEPTEKSRLKIPNSLDCGPKPPDDPASKCLMDCPDGHQNQEYWSSIPDAVSIESMDWLQYLPRKENGDVQLDQQVSVDLALLHSRDYQSQYEQVYLTALRLTGNQFEFDTQWAGGVGADFTSTGEDLGNRRLFQISDRLGFNRSLAGGGQVATNLLNSVFWDFRSGQFDGNGQLVTTFTQPLLRGAYRHVRLENLTQAERDLLYQVRDFARFRRQTYAEITGRFLQLLTQRQSIRNAETNIESLKLNLVEHQEMQTLKMVSQIQVDQIFQEYQNGRLTLLNSQQQLATAMDDFKFQIGLPAWVQLEIDESILKPFELVSPDLELIQQESQKLYDRMLKYTPTESTKFETAPYEFLIESFEEYVKLQDRLAAIKPEVDQQLKHWQEHLKKSKSGRKSENDQLDIQQQKELTKRLEKDLGELQRGLDSREAIDRELRTKIDILFKKQPEVKEEKEKAEADKNGTAAKEKKEVKVDEQQEPETDREKQSAEADELSAPPEVKAWQALYQAINGPLREEISNLYIYQTQIRLFLIDVPPLELDGTTAVTYAHQNRLDQMNRKAQVMDAFRKVEVAADALESVLTVNGQIGLGTDPDRSNPFRFDSSANTYRAGVQFDGPLNRLNERNVYRASQIAYQQAARNYMAGRDSIANDVRAAVRQIELSRLNFQIARQQLVAASRQVDEAKFNIRTITESNTNLTRDLLQSLQGLLAAKNNLISNWIDYKILRIRIFVALELLYMDENGVWINDDFDLTQLSEWTGESDYFPFQAVTPSDVDRLPLAEDSANQSDDERNEPSDDRDENTGEGTTPPQGE